jgi:hypothetical protein
MKSFAAAQGIARWSRNQSDDENVIPIVSDFFGSAAVPTASVGVPPTESLDRN